MVKGRPVSRKAAQVQEEPEKNPLLVSRPKNFAIGNDLPPKRDVTRFVRWPKYVTRQRQKRVLERRLKVPPSLNLFRVTLEKSTKSELFKFMAKYKPETQKQAAARREEDASAKKKNPKSQVGKKAACLKHGIQQVTRMVEERRAKLVVIAHDVDPIEIVVWLPALCKAQGIPYCIVKGKAALGALVNMKTTSCVCLDAISSEHTAAFNSLEAAVTSYSEVYDNAKRAWGGLQMGRKGRSTAK